MADTTRRLVFAIESIGDQKLIKAVAELRLVFKQLTQEMNAANKSGNRQLFDDLAVAQAKVKKQIQDTTKELKDQNRAFENSKYPSDSLRALEAQYAKVTEKIKGMSQAQLNSAGGKKLISDFKGISDEINKQNIAFGNYTKNIGRYGESISNAFTSAFSFLTIAGATRALISLGTETAKSVINIEKLYFQIRNLTSVADADIELFKKKIPELSNSIGKSQEELLKGLYQITSAQITGQKAIDILTDSAKLSAIGLGDVNTIARTLAGTINAYGKENLDASRSAEVLFQVVKLGSGDIDQIAQSFSDITTNAAHLKIPVEQLAASVASLTNKGIPASEAITKIGSVLIALEKPAKGGKKVLEEFGLSYEQLRGLAKIDLIRTLKLLADTFGENEEAISKVFGKKESLIGFFGLTDDAAKEALKTLSSIKTRFDEIDTVTDKYKETKASTLERWANRIKNAFIDLGGGLAQFLEEASKIPAWAFGGFQSRLEPPILKGKDLQQTLTVQGQVFGKPQQSDGGPRLPDDFDKSEAERTKPKKTKEELKAEAEAFRKFLLEKASDLKNALKDEDDLQLDANQLHAKRTKDFFDEETRLINKHKLTQKQLYEDVAAFQVEEAKRYQEDIQRQRQRLLLIEQAAAAEAQRLKDVKAARELDKELLKPLPSIQSSADHERQSKVNAIAGGKPLSNDKTLEILNNEDQKRKQIEKAFEFAAVDTFTAIGNAAIDALSREDQAIQKNRDLRLSSLDKEYEKRKAFAAGNADLINRIEQERLQKEEKIRKEAADKQKAIAIKQAIINSALAATNTLANIPPPFNFIALIPLAASLALQIAAIKAQKFDKGGMTGPGTVRDETGQKVAGVVHQDEYVSPKKQVIKYPNLLHWMDAERTNPGLKASDSVVKEIKGFDEGGFGSTSKKIPTVMLALSPNRYDRVTTGGFTTPPIIVKFPKQIESNKDTKAIFTDEQIAFLANEVGMRVHHGAKEGAFIGSQQAVEENRKYERLQQKLAV